jgi:hypothetical protein
MRQSALTSPVDGVLFLSGGDSIDESLSGGDSIEESLSLLLSGSLTLPTPLVTDGPHIIL